MGVAEFLKHRQQPLLLEQLGELRRDLDGADGFVALENYGDGVAWAFAICSRMALSMGSMC